MFQAAFCQRFIAKCLIVGTVVFLCCKLISSGAQLLSQLNGWQYETTKQKESVSHKWLKGLDYSIWDQNAMTSPSHTIT